MPRLDCEPGLFPLDLLAGQIPRPAWRV